jgi:hypothetical protein
MTAAANFHQLRDTTGAATAATLAFIGTSWKDGRQVHQMLVPLGFFMLGLACMACGSVAFLLKEGFVLRRIQRAGSPLKMRADDVGKYPSERSGFDLHDWRTRFAIMAASRLISGCGLGYLELLTTAP